MPLYSHNDYRGPRPLFDAVDAGFLGVEVDVFLVDGVLRVGHDRAEARRGPTFEASYLAPLASLVERCGGSATTTGSSFLLLVELKEASRASYDSTLAQLGRHRSTFRPTGDAPAPVEVVFVGWMPPLERPIGDVQALSRTQHRMRDPSDTLIVGNGWPVRLISIDYGKTMGRWWTRAGGRRRWLGSISAVRRRYPRHLLRVHNVPADGAVIAQLLGVGVDLIGATNVRRFASLLEHGPQRSAPPR